MEDELLVKCIIVGDICVGKTSILSRFVTKTFSPEYEITIGVEFGGHRDKILSKNVKYQIWDTAGLERFKSITTSYYKKTAIAFVVFSLANCESFRNVIGWIEDVYNHSHNPDIRIVLVGNKCDLDKTVTDREIDVILKLYPEIPYYVVSAKTGRNIENLFIESVKPIVQNHIENPEIKMQGVSLRETEPTSKSCCKIW